MTRIAERAEELFFEGYNCAQAVFAASAEELGMTAEDALKIASSFGGGMGRMREVCGAMTGLFMAAGYARGYADADDKTAKTSHYQLIQDLAAEFREAYGSIICRDLILPEDASSDPTPADRTSEYYERRPCSEYVRFAGAQMDRLLNR